MSSSFNIQTGSYNQLNVGVSERILRKPIENNQFRFIERLFAIAVGLVTTASIYDAFLVYQYREVITEQNPICDWLISLDPDTVSFFLLFKGLGTAAVILILAGLFKYWKQVAIPVAMALVLFQVGLMLYLHGSEIQPTPIFKLDSLADNSWQPQRDPGPTSEEDESRFETSPETNRGADYQRRPWRRGRPHRFPGDHDFGSDIEFRKMIKLIREFRTNRG